MTAMDEWLAAARNALAAEAGIAAAELELSAADEAELLDLARIAAHDSGERTNAPLLCYLVGVAARAGTGVDRLAAAVRRSSS
jgi:Domain of unknown function (DUF6457)